MALLRGARGGKDYDAAFGARMTGEGPYAWVTGRRFELAAARLGYAKTRSILRTDLFTPPARSLPAGLAAGLRRSPNQLSLFEL